MARVYSSKFKVEEKKMRERLWGDHYFDILAKKWSTNPIGENGTTLKRCFV
jgi:elongation factor 2